MRKPLPIALLLLVFISSCQKHTNDIAPSGAGWNNAAYQAVNYPGDFLMTFTVAKPQDLTVDLWYWDVTENGDDAISESQDEDPQDSFLVLAEFIGAEGTKTSNFTAKSEFTAGFDRAATVVIRTTTKSGNVSWTSFKTTNNAERSVLLSVAKSGRIAASKTDRQSLYIQTQTNDLTFGQRYTVHFWKFDKEPTLTSRFDGSSVTGKLPTYVAEKTNGLRLYFSKSLPVGWYVASLAETGFYYKFRIVKGEKGMLSLNDENNPKYADGYFPQASFLAVTCYTYTEPTIYVTVPNGSVFPTVDNTVTATYHLFSRDGTGTNHRVQFCIPTRPGMIHRPEVSGIYSGIAINPVAGKTISIALKNPHVGS